MKTNLLLIIIILLIPNILFCYPFSTTADTCNLIIAYRLTYQPDSASKNTKSELMRLMIGNSSSVFESVGQYKQDTLRANSQNQPSGFDNMQKQGSQILSLGRSSFRYQIYRESSQPFLYYYEKIARQTLYYKEPTIAIKWKITNSKKQISGYLCQLATTSFAGRDIEAWFTREIPYSDGPYKFKGLPGLILEVNDTKNHYRFDFIKTEKPLEKIFITHYEGAISTTKQKFNQAKRDYEVNLSDRISAMGHPVSQEDRKDYQERLKKKNNPLELKP